MPEKGLGGVITEGGAKGSPEDKRKEPELEASSIRAFRQEDSKQKGRPQNRAEKEASVRIPQGGQFHAVLDADGTGLPSLTVPRAGRICRLQLTGFPRAFPNKQWPGPLNQPGLP